MDFSELLAQLTNPGEDGVPPTIYDDLSASYTDATSTRDAKITESDARAVELETELSRVKSMNYDLMVAAAGENVGESNDTSPVEESDDVGDVDDMFEDEDKK